MLYWEINLIKQLLLERMLEVKNNIGRDLIKNAFDAGYTNAAASFSKIMKDKVGFANLHAGFHSIDKASFMNQPLIKSNEPSWLITTEVFGEVIGKSYLMFSEKEFEVMIDHVLGVKHPVNNLMEEFIKELDNILSASVITQLANTFNLKMYGDIPNLVGITRGTIENIIYDDYYEQSNEKYINAIHFSLGSHPAFQPLFAWVIEGSTIQGSATKNISVN